MSLQATATAEFVTQDTAGAKRATKATATDARSFDEVFALHHRAVYRTAYAIARDAALAEDITQEVFLQFYRHAEAAPGEELLRAWLLRVAINIARNALRGQHRAAAREDVYAHEESCQKNVAPAPDNEYERRALIESVARTLERINEPMRSCLLLKQQGLSYREIAVALSIKETNVGSLIARGRKEFVRMYGKIGGRQS